LEFSRETQSRNRDKDFFVYKEMEFTHTTVGLTSLNFVGQVSRLETEADNDTIVLRQDFFFSENPVFGFEIFN
jgi:hypothetical protein